MKGVPLSFTIVQFLQYITLGWPYWRELRNFGFFPIFWKIACQAKATAGPQVGLMWKQSNCCTQAANGMILALTTQISSGKALGNRGIDPSTRTFWVFWSLRWVGIWWNLCMEMVWTSNHCCHLEVGLKMRCVNGVSDLGLRRQTPCPRRKRNRMPQTHFVFRVRLYPRLYLKQ